MANMPMGTWKGFERRICSRFMSARIPVAASGYGGTLRGARDGESRCGRFDYQIKKRAKASIADLAAWLREIVDTSTKRARVGVLVYNRPGETDAEALVVLRADQWEQVLDLLGRGDRLAELEAALEARGVTVDAVLASAPATAKKGQVD